MQDQKRRLQKMTEKRSLVGLFFLDSGAHSLYNIHIYNRPEVMAKPIHRRYDYYDTDEFWQYVDAYAAFVKKYKDSIDYYANVDVIYDPGRSWKVQKYLENEHGLAPVPVLHWGADLKWFEKHIDAGYEFLGIGGLGQGATRKSYTRWADGVFDFICPRPDRLPIVRTHGFAMTSYSLMLRYPWWSVDSATWTKVGAYGSIFVPHKRRGVFTFDEEPYIVTVSEDSPSKKQAGKHIESFSQGVKKIIYEWLEHIEVPFGKTSPDGEVVEYGIINRHSERKIANLLFFEALREWLGPYPRKFGGQSQKGLLF